MILQPTSIRTCLSSRASLARRLKFLAAHITNCHHLSLVPFRCIVATKSSHLYGLTHVDLAGKMDAQIVPKHNVYLDTIYLPWIRNFRWCPYRHYPPSKKKGFSHNVLKDTIHFPLEKAFFEIISVSRRICFISESSREFERERGGKAASQIHDLLFSLALHINVNLHRSGKFSFSASKSKRSDHARIWTEKPWKAQGHYPVRNDARVSPGKPRAIIKDVMMFFMLDSNHLTRFNTIHYGRFIKLVDYYGRKLENNAGYSFTQGLYRFTPRERAI